MMLMSKQVTTPQSSRKSSSSENGASTVVYETRPQDVIFGRHRQAFLNGGNLQLRQEIANVLEHYKTQNRTEKSHIIRSLVYGVQARGGRFLKQIKPLPGCEEVEEAYYIVGSQEEARQKVSAAVRDACADKVKCMIDLASKNNSATKNNTMNTHASLLSVQRCRTKKKATSIKKSARGEMTNTAVPKSSSHYSENSSIAAFNEIMFKNLHRDRHSGMYYTVQGPQSLNKVLDPVGPNDSLRAALGIIGPVTTTAASTTTTTTPRPESAPTSSPLEEIPFTEAMMVEALQDVEERQLSLSDSELDTYNELWLEDIHEL